tara:strand:- start:351 stop:860 length:510 start_codon:yes stop_codon:yes gene_type:complete
MVDKFKGRLKESGLSDNAGKVVVIHCPINILVSRIDGRNAKAIKDCNPDDVRKAFFPFSQYGSIYERTLEPLDSSKLAVGVVSREDIVGAAAKFGGGRKDVSSLLDNLGFKYGDEEVFVTPKIPCDQIYQTAVQSPQQIAESLCANSFPPRPPTEDIQNDDDLKNDFNI